MTLPVGHDDNPASTITWPPAHAGHPEQLQTHTTDPGRQDPVVALLGSLRSEIGEQNFQHWFHKRTRFQVSGDRFVVYVANPFILNWLLRRFRSALNRAAQLVLGPSASCQLEVDESLLETTTATTNPEISVADTDRANQGQERPQGGAALNRKRTSTASPSPSEYDRPGSLTLPNNRRKFRSFDSFVSGECNDLAVLACQTGLSRSR